MRRWLSLQLPDLFARCFELALCHLQLPLQPSNLEHGAVELALEISHLLIPLPKVVEQFGRWEQFCFWFGRWLILGAQLSRERFDVALMEHLPPPGFMCAEASLFTFTVTVHLARADSQNIGGLFDGNVFIIHDGACPS